MENTKVIKRVGTHDGRFHTDEVMATAILKELYQLEITRTRDKDILDKLDIVYDVGGGEFDHHGTIKEYRDNGIPYAASGLIWRKYGRDVVRKKAPNLSEDEVEDVFDYIDRVLIEGIDALDNGIRPDRGEIHVMSITQIVSGFNPPWYLEKSEDERFIEVVNILLKVLNNIIVQRLAVLKAKDTVVKAYDNRTISQAIILDKFCPWGEALREVDTEEEVLFVIYNRKDGSYAMQTTRGQGGKDKKYLPKSWGGKTDEELAAITGVEDAVFCHTGRFIAVAKSFEGIMKMCKLAIDEPEEIEERSIIDIIKNLFVKR